MVVVVFHCCLSTTPRRRETFARGEGGDGHTIVMLTPFCILGWSPLRFFF